MLDCADYYLIILYLGLPAVGLALVTYVECKRWPTGPCD